ncbi:glycoside hydrolase family 88 protein [Streptomyces brasiliensis]|uniref:CBM6 domain-containing protein n=1 Tax=Streptomyces brasiliensis TaxID=1954 RepID=A0A917P3H1_9ACTN|nr:glycoside hydrolase family 88 protein [Streptomyces brasiliensis]GGJ59337.1 hypothetical protein GCM10010121_082560 [Streptomyces brasiliensis]
MTDNAMGRPSRRALLGAGAAIPLLAGLPTPARADDASGNGVRVYEAETGTLSGASLATASSGYSGTGYVAFPARSGSWVEWTVEAPRPGTVPVSFRYSLADVTAAAALRLELSVDGVPCREPVEFAPTGGGADWHSVTTYVRFPDTGPHRLRAATVTDAGGPLLDWVALGEWPRAAQDWSQALVESTMRRSTPATLGGWGYGTGLYLYGQYLVYQRLRDPRYLEYIRTWADRFVDASGHIGDPFDSLDSMQAGNILLILHSETGDNRYRTAAQQIRDRLRTYPRTSDGGFWHYTTRQWQLWGDGTYMLLPFLIRYGHAYGEVDYADDEVAHQLNVYGTHLQDASGLLMHAYDESGAQPWADPVTHRAPEKWARAMGWYGMAATVALEYLPDDHPGRPGVEAILGNLMQAWLRYQDSATGCWYQVVDKGADSRNWTETSATSMYTWTLARAIQRGALSHREEPRVLAGYRGVLERIALGPTGLTDLTDIVTSTSVGDLLYYFARSRAANDQRGLGSFLITNELLAHGNTGEFTLR